MNERILRLWDSYTESLQRILDNLIEGKSELAAIMLSSLRESHNGQSREFLCKELRKESEARDETRSKQEKNKY
jgi:hypothetical protein